MESILDILPGRKLFNKIECAVLNDKFYVDREDHFLVKFLGYSRFHVYTRTFQIEDRFVMEIDLIDLHQYLYRIFLQITNIENLDVNVITTCQNFKMEFFSSSFLEAEDKFDSGIQTLPSNLIAMSPDDNMPLFLFGLYNMVESRLNEIPGPKLYFE